MTVTVKELIDFLMTVDGDGEVWIGEEEIEARGMRVDVDGDVVIE